MLRRQLLNTSRGRIVALLQRGALTADEIASKLGLTPNAVRAQITAMERDGVVRRAGRRRGTTRPSHVFALTAEAEQVLSRAYVPLLTQLVSVAAERLSAAKVEALLRETGKKLAEALKRGRPLAGSLRARVSAASQLMNDELGAVTHVEENGCFVIRGAACPIGALTGTYAPVCVAMESFVAEIVGAPVRAGCERTGSPRCSFEVRARKTS